MDLKELVLKNRTYRRFRQEIPVREETLKDLVELARNASSGKNAQPLRYILSAEPVKNARIFENLAWAGYLKDWDGPEEGERPAAYIVVLNDTEISGMPQVDSGLAMQAILLGAVEKGLGGCMFGSIKRKALAEALGVPERYEILYVVALGEPMEEVVLEDIGPDGDFKYYRDGNKVHHVPKRSLGDIIIG
jgi:nitroreductase